MAICSALFAICHSSILALSSSFSVIAPHSSLRSVSRAFFSFSALSFCSRSFAHASCQEQ